MSIQDVEKSDTTLLELEEDGIDYGTWDWEVEDVPESDSQFELADYLVDVFKYQYRAEGWYIIGNMEISQPGYSAVAPDVAIHKIVAVPRVGRKTIKSWRMGKPDRPAPAVVFEISSTNTWKTDLAEKVIRYQQMGVREYFAYDPTVPQVWKDKSRRLRGWSYQDGSIQELQPDARGWLWSEELDSWLAPAVNLLHLYDRDGNRRPTGEEAERTARIQAEMREKATDTALQDLLRKLRQHGINPDSL